MVSTPPAVLIVQPMADDGPAFLTTWLQEQGIAFQLVRVFAGDTVPRSAAGWRGVVMLGGAMSVNDDLPFLHDAEALLRDAVHRCVPVLGHCLGGQMLARALGAATTDNPVPEVGWAHIDLADQALARDWLGDVASGTAEPLPVFQWHYQTFALPAGATLLASNAACAHQAFAFGPHLGMQFHIEVDAEKLNRWCAEAPASALADAHHASVQDEARMRADTHRLLASSQATARRIYARWWSLAQAAVGV
ncbi:MAG: GMP synthase [Burkholderiales bacterium PBB6]|nr:MAG: GMP synthase [Burkholderiales bacterium PBB6]